LKVVVGATSIEAKVYFILSEKWTRIFQMHYPTFSELRIVFPKIPGGSFIFCFINFDFNPRILKFKEETVETQKMG